MVYSELYGFRPVLHSGRKCNQFPIKMCPAPVSYTHLNMAENTIAAYLYAVREYYSRHKELNKRNLLVYKTYLIEKFKPKL